MLDTQDGARMDRMFRSSGLLRDKWERDDYRQRTIDAAIAGTAEVYRPSAPERRRDVARTARPERRRY